MHNTEDRYTVYYARIHLDRKGTPGQRATLHGSTIYLGGAGITDKATAEREARNIVNSASRFAAQTLLPHVFRMKDDEEFIDTTYRAQEWFETRIRDMNEADAIMEPSLHLPGKSK